ncbi:MAG: hypothetical protein IH820_08365 [Bacteroidetes bacterium]|nr:hypothetical protein [Bacteroidota bacterium]
MITEEEENSGAEKPEAEEWLIDHIAEVSKNAWSLYLLFLSFLAMTHSLNGFGMSAGGNSASF